MDTDKAEVDADLVALEGRYFTASDRADVVQLRNAIEFLARAVVLFVPRGRQRAIVLTLLEEVQMRANRGIFAPEAHR